jgi:hypothetical protein
MVGGHVYGGSLASSFTDLIQEIFLSGLLQRTWKYARSPLFSIGFPLVQDQKGWSPHQIVPGIPSKTSYTSPPATYPFPWRTCVHGLRLWQRIQAQSKPVFVPTSPPFLQISVHSSPPSACMFTLPCTPARPTLLSWVLTLSLFRNHRFPGLWRIVRRPCPSGVLRTRSQRTW